MLTDINGDNFLQLMADKGDVKKVAELLLQGVSMDELNYQNPYGNTALYLAANHNHINVVKLLLAHGADPELANAEGQKPVDAAVRQGLFDVCALLGRALPIDPPMDPIDNL
ncbi:ANK domain containing protein [uncultured Caudovirales phage]|uniref:ANK domain containing protein n=1 Tax=uncultured Caudovirales phage TaxID=2100421 RepID=A0A6J7XDP7_9CAUD|nr:ANK domain containing protein [uncultured Caudovirales phage]CAB5228127.1 ANK domain containing protein [uncultured Caudovirales phage]